MLEEYRVEWQDVIAHYNHRLDLSNKIRKLFIAQAEDFAAFCLGIIDPQANYSASEHALGPRILSNNVNARNRIANLAGKLQAASSSSELARFIKTASIDWLKISVGSEISMMLRPDECWVANSRTIWAHLLLKHDWNEGIANEELKLYRDGDETSEMAYKKWAAIHKEMQKHILDLAVTGSRLARSEKLEPGAHQYLWADAISNWLYENS